MAKVSIFKGDITRSIPLGNNTLFKGDVVRSIGINKISAPAPPVILPGILNIDGVTIANLASFNGVAKANINNINGIS